MLIAHGPAGYLLGRIFSRTLFKDTVLPDRQKKFYRYLIAAGILGGIFPDFDFFYHLAIDSSRTPHHSYFTHMPVFWLATWLILVGIGLIRRNKVFMAVATTFCLSALLHLVLDTLTGVIYWFYPLSARGVNIVKVADSHHWWVENFTHHWTFIIEIAIVTVAMAVFLRVRETVTDITHLFRQHEKLRAITFRLAVCACGITIVAAVASMKFSIDNRALAKAARMKRHLVAMIESRNARDMPKPPRVPGTISELRRKGAATFSDSQ